MSEPDWDVLFEFVSRWESFRAYPYDDARPSVRVRKEQCYYMGGQYKGPYGGTVTIGYGETNASFIDEHWDGVLVSEAEERKKLQLQVYWKAGVLHSGLRTDHLNPYQAAAWASIFYNSGAAGPSLHAAHLVTLSNWGEWQRLADAWKEAIINRGTQFEEGLRNRRAAEVQLLLTPYKGRPFPVAVLT